MSLRGRGGRRNGYERAVLAWTLPSATRTALFQWDNAKTNFKWSRDGKSTYRFTRWTDPSIKYTDNESAEPRVEQRNRATEENVTKTYLSNRRVGTIFAALWLRWKRNGHIIWDSCSSGKWSITTGKDWLLTPSHSIKRLVRKKNLREIIFRATVDSTAIMKIKSKTDIYGLNFINSAQCTNNCLKFQYLNAERKNIVSWNIGKKTPQQR